MNRQSRRRIEREWKKIGLTKLCTKFVERNGLFTIPYTVALQAIKISDDLMCVYHIGIFGFKEGFGYLERLTVCQFVNGLFRRLSSAEIGFIPEENFDSGEEI